MALGDGAVVDGINVISLQISSRVIAVEVDIIGDNKFEGGRIWRMFFFSSNLVERSGRVERTRVGYCIKAMVTE